MAFSRIVVGLFASALLLCASQPAFAQQGRPDGAAAVAEGAKALSAGQHELAVQQLSKAIRSEGLPQAEAARAYYMRGLAYQKLGSGAQAIADLTAAMYLKGLSPSEQARAHYTRGLAYQAIGASDRADADLREAHRLAPDDKTIAQTVATRGGGQLPANVGTFETRVETADLPKREQPAPKPTPSMQPFETKVETTPQPKPVVTPQPKQEIAAFQTRVDPVKEQPKPTPSEIPGFRTTISPEAPPPPTVVRKEPPQPPTQSWTTSVATQPAPPPAEEKPQSGGSAFSRFMSTIRPTTAPKETKPTEVATTQPQAGQWTQTTVPGDKQPAPTAGGRYLVQLASLKSAEEAQAFWSRLSAKHQDLVAGHQPRIEKTDLGNLGIHYRVQIGPFADKKETLQLCNAFQRDGVDCFMVTQ